VPGVVPYFSLDKSQKSYMQKSVSQILVWFISRVKSERHFGYVLLIFGNTEHDPDQYIMRTEDTCFWQQHKEFYEVHTQHDWQF
jgi:hypothetical protein